MRLPVQLQRAMAAEAEAAREARAKVTTTFRNVLRSNKDILYCLRVMINMYRGPTDLVQHCAYWRSSHRRKGAARHIIGMVWLYRSPIPVGKGGWYLTSSNYFYLPSQRLEEWEGGSQQNDYIFFIAEFVIARRLICSSHRFEIK